MTIGPRIQCQLHAPKASLTGRPRWSPFMFYNRAMQMLESRRHFRQIELARIDLERDQAEVSTQSRQENA